MTNKITKLKIFGKNIQRARKACGLSQNTLAEMLDISREHLAKVETAKRGLSLDLIFRIADVLHIKEKDLFDFE